MFNGGRFNLQPFNILASSGIALKTNAYEIVDTLIYVAQIQFLTTNAAEVIGTNEIVLNQGIVLVEAASEVISSSATLFGNVPLETSSSEEIEVDLILAANYYLANHSLESIETSAVLDANYYFSANSFETVTGLLTLGLKYFLTANANTIINASIGALYSVDIVNIEINMPIPPGGRLVIDSANVLVLLNGENYVDIHAGGWFDELCRNVMEVTVNGTGAENVQSTLIYTERYL